jgi:type IV secretory pathway VirB10-like protein
MMSQTEITAGGSSAEMDAELIMGARTEGKKKFILPGWTKPVGIIFALVGTVWLITSLLSSSGKSNLVDAGAIAPANPKEIQTLGDDPTMEYNKRLSEYANKKSDEAAQSGRTYVAPIVAGSRPIMETEKPAEAPKTQPQTDTSLKGASPARTAPPRRAEQRQKGDQHMLQYMSQLNARLSPTDKSLVLVLNKPAPKIIRTSAGDAGETDITIPPGVKTGDILYAVNRITLDSDAPGPSMVEVIDGPYAGGKALGTFKRMNEHLTLEFSTLTMPNGTQYNIKGYAVDPKTDRTAVRSAVDNHTFERWFKFAAAKFLEGFSEAISTSGSSYYSGPYGGGYSSPKLNLEQQLWIAGGHVGQGAARIFERDFSIPPTVTLKSGTEIGILVVSVGKSDNQASTRQVITDQQSASQKREEQHFNTPLPPAPARNLPGYYRNQ